MLSWVLKDGALEFLHKYLHRLPLKDLKLYGKEYFDIMEVSRELSPNYFWFTNLSLLFKKS